MEGRGFEVEWRCKWILTRWTRKYASNYRIMKVVAGMFWRRDETRARVSQDFLHRQVRTQQHCPTADFQWRSILKMEPFVPLFRIWGLTTSSLMWLYTLEMGMDIVFICCWWTLFFPTMIIMSKAEYHEYKENRIFHFTAEATSTVCLLSDFQLITHKTPATGRNGYSVTAAPSRNPNVIR